MFLLSLDSYFSEIDEVLIHPLVTSVSCKKEKRSSRVGLIRGRISFVGGSELDFMEYLEIDEEIEKKTYSYHFKLANHELIFRYDNAPHHNYIPTFPKHKHLKDGSITSSDEISLNAALQEAVSIIMAK